MGHRCTPAIPIGPRPMVWAERVAPGPVVTVVGPHVFGAPDHRWQDHCLRLAAAAGSPLLQVSLGAADGTWVMVGADPARPAFPQPPATRSSTCW